MKNFRRRISRAENLLLGKRLTEARRAHNMVVRRVEMSEEEFVERYVRMRMELRGCTETSARRNAGVALHLMRDCGLYKDYYDVLLGILPAFDRPEILLEGM